MSLLLPTQDRDRRGARRPVELGQGDPRLVGYLPIARGAAQLVHQLEHLPQSGCADRLAVGEQAAVGVDRQPAADLGDSVGEQGLLFAVLAQHRLGHVNDFGAGVGVLQLGDVDVLRADTRDLVGGLGGLGGGAGNDG